MFNRIKYARVTVLDKAKLASDVNSFYNLIEANTPNGTQTLFGCAKRDYGHIFDRKDSEMSMLMFINNIHAWDVDEYMTCKNYHKLTIDAMNNAIINSKFHNAIMNYQYGINMNDGEM